jgi:hypothetical protein
MGLRHLKEKKIAMRKNLIFLAVLFGVIVGDASFFCPGGAGRTIFAVADSFQRRGQVSLRIQKRL